MLVIVASQWDPAPRAFASHCAAQEVGVLTPRDLSVAGWRQRLNSMESGIVVVDRKLVPQREITGVLTLLPRVVEQELVDIVPGDRRYVASEMTAFLLFWLSRLKCPVLNRPTPTCLAGPYWREEKWVRVAAQAGIPVRPVRRQAAPSASGDAGLSALGASAKEEFLPESATVTVIGKRIFGEADPGLCRQAQHLAELAGVELLSVRFSSPRRDAHFVSADTFPNLSDNALADAVLDRLRGAPTGCM
jgi:hypothetical protein